MKLCISSSLTPVRKIGSIKPGQPDEWRMTQNYKLGLFTVGDKDKPVMIDRLQKKKNSCAH